MAATDSIKVSVFRRGGNGNYQLQYRDPITGTKVRKSSGTFKLREAERKAAVWQKELETTARQPNGRTPWGLFREEYETQVLDAQAVNTDKKATGVLNVYTLLMRPRVLADVTTEALTRYQTLLRGKGRRPSTIQSHMAHIRAALSWGVDNEYLAGVPKIPKVARVKNSKKMKGRAITTEEFERVLAKVDDIIRKPNLGRSKKRPAPDTDRIPSWKYLIEGLWWSGLRLAESLELHWTDDGRLCVDLSCRFPMLRIPAELEKGNKDRLLPMAPEFAEFLLRTPEHKREGFVFNPLPQRFRNERIGAQQVGRTISKIGREAKVKVDEHDGSPVYASAHDFRRSFGERWSERIMPKQLMELMRHESIETTMRYYVGRNAQKTAAILWEAAGAGLGAVLGAAPDEAPSKPLNL